MKKFKANVAQHGFFAGPVFRIQSIHVERDLKKYDFASEKKKYQEACNKLANELLYGSISKKNAEIRRMTAQLIKDEAFTDKVLYNLKNLMCSAAYSVQKSSEELCDEIENVDNDYIKSRQEDIRGAAQKLIAILEKTPETPEVCSVLCAEEISPALISSIDESLIGALLSVKGSPNSHASILAGNLGIPYLYGYENLLEDLGNAEYIIVDSESGYVIIDPDEEEKRLAIERMNQLMEERKKSAQEEADADDIECRTKIYANIAGPEDIEELINSGADGVGLFRTEFLFLNRNTAPSEEEQYCIYKEVLDAMGEKEVIIRTMDIGSDKQASWFKLPDESNPALGLRGVRVSLENKDIFRAQMRALLRAGASGHLKVMFPMISSDEEIDEIVAFINEMAKELDNEGATYRIPKIGIMVETPSAAVCADILAEKVSFFSIGTNDLTQYTLALDREAQGLDKYFRPHHEAIFRLIGMTAQSGKNKGIVTGVCGQLAADPQAIPRLIKEGVDELSVPVKRVRRTRILVAKAEAELTMNEVSLIKAETNICAIADGILYPMNEIPDEAFSSGKMGECFGILPENGNVYAPISGTIESIAETGHAIVIKGEDGIQILVHVGIDTVSLGRRAFSLHVSEGESVVANQLLMEANLDMIKKAELSPMIIVVKLKRI